METGRNGERHVCDEQSYQIPAQTISANRLSMAKLVQPDEFVAMKACDDDEGSSFWLIRAKQRAWKYTGPTKIEDGVRFVRGGWYIYVQYYERFSSQSQDTFRLSPRVWSENMEGV